MMTIFSRRYSINVNKTQLFHGFFAVVIVLQSLWMPLALAADSAGQKAHFQVEDKSGDLKITATKDQAKVTAQADSVQVVVKPGTAEYPVLKSDKPIVHVTQPGWSSISFRKSAIFKRKIPLRRQSKKSEGNKPRKILRLRKRVYSQIIENFKAGQKLKRVFEGKGFSILPENQGKRVTKQSAPDKQNVSGSKKSDVKYAGFHVSGDAGKLKMHVTKDETTLSSESGGVDISLNKHPSSSSTASDQRRLDARPQTFRDESADKTVHVATELESSVSNYGLRKSVVTKLRDVGKTDWD